MNETIDSSFPQTRQNLSDLKNTAVDAANDLGSTASVHAKKVQDNLQNLASTAQREGSEHLNQAKSAFNDLGTAAREYVAARPLAAVGIALLFGFIVGKLRSSRS
jgi:ElaB/YqjD/DUF883 family membrane-anchored ribosome-binding protein